MSELFDRIDEKKSRDMKILGNFISIYCREKHGTEHKTLYSSLDERVNDCLGDKEILVCDDCRKLMNHGLAKMMQCPHDPKPMCKKCETHCYAPGYRDKIREVMKFSGLYLVKHGRVDLMYHYFH